MTRPTTSVIICAHTMERLEDIRAAVASVEAQTQQPDELLLVIDYNQELLDAVADLGHKVVPNSDKKLSLIHI